MKASSRNKQLQCYKGNWATLEIMKTMLKNWQNYQSRIGSIDQYNNHNSKDINGDELAGMGMGEEEEDGKGDGNIGDDWEDMYVKHLVDNGRRDEEDVNDGKDIDGSENGSEDEDGNSGKDIRGL